MAILTVGIDLAKNVFPLHCVNEAGRAELVLLGQYMGWRTSRATTSQSSQLVNVA